MKTHALAIAAVLPTLIASARLHNYLVNACKKARTCSVLEQTASPDDPKVTHTVRVQLQKHASGGVAIVTLLERGKPTPVYSKDLSLPVQTYTGGQLELQAVANADDDIGSNRTPGFVVGGLGLVVAGVGGVFGILTLTNQAHAKDLCPSHVGCSDEALSARNRAGTYATVSNVLLGVGAVGVGVGTWLLLRTPTDPEAAKGPTWRLQADLSRTGLTLSRDF
jgi:hypothetical protein